MTSNNYLLKVFALTFGIIGSIFLALGLTFLFGMSGDPEIWVVIMVFAPLGGIFAIIGLIFFLIHHTHLRKIKRLKRVGERYDAEIVRIREKPYSNMNYRNPFIVECGYRDRRGTTYLVKSGSLWPSSMLIKREDIRARVWVNPDNSKDYYVEVYLASEEAKTNMRFDYDYR